MSARQSKKRRGVLAGGNWIIDQVKLVDVYPQPEQLANIRGQYQGSGGAPYNVLIDLAKLGVRFPLWAAGLVGKDALGQAILKDCKQNGIDTRNLRASPAAPTSYTDVMTETANGRRTFFHHRGANARWRGEGLSFAKLPAAIFHLGYLLLLDALDQRDATYGTRAARLLAAAQRAGMKTSVDVVSEESDRFMATVGPALKHVDYCILNEIEAGKTTGFTLRQPEGELDTAAMRNAARALLQSGVRELVVIHCPEGGFASTRDGDDLWQPALRLPPQYIAGTAGAGDAFCAGMLLGLHEGWELDRCLQAAVAVAAASLAHPTCTGGMKPLKTCLGLARKHGYQAPLSFAG